MKNYKKYGVIGEMGWSIMGVGKWRIRRNILKSDKWSGRQWGREVENSKKFGEIRELGWPMTMGVGKWRIRINLENSEKWASQRPWGSGTEEF